MNALEPKSTALVFDQQPRESSKAFAAFQTYLELGPERSLAAVAEKLGTRKPHDAEVGARSSTGRRGSPPAMRTWPRSERKAIERLAVEKAVEWWKLHEPARREAWLEAERAIAMVRKARERWEKSGRTPGFEGMARMLELAFKLKQFAAGMPTEVKETHTHVTGKVSWSGKRRSARPTGWPTSPPPWSRSRRCPARWKMEPAGAGCYGGEAVSGLRHLCTRCGCGGLSDGPDAQPGPRLRPGCRSGNWRPVPPPGCATSRTGRRPSATAVPVAVGSRIGCWRRWAWTTASGCRS